MPSEGEMVGKISLNTHIITSLPQDLYYICYSVESGDIVEFPWKKENIKIFRLILSFGKVAAARFYSTLQTIAVRPCPALRSPLDHLHPHPHSTTSVPGLARAPLGHKYHYSV